MRLRISDCGLRIEATGHPAAGGLAALRPSALRLPPSALRSGMTLIELLVTILIIAILGSLVLGVAAVAGQTAREAKTRSMITKLHTLLVQQYDSYRTRRVEVRRQVTVSGGAESALARLFALREMMLMEMPDRWSDVLLGAVPSNPAGANDAKYPRYLDPGTAAYGRTPLAALYLRQYARITDNNWKNKLTSAPNTQAEILAYQGAECLYMIIMFATGDGEARSLFNENDIGDTDGDGAPEFLDGWGHPISFLRWAPGFESQIQIDANRFNDPPPPNLNNPDPSWLAAASRDHDPLDLYRVDPLAFRMVPLVFSAGRDEVITTPRDGENQRYETYGMAMPDPAAATWPGLSTAELDDTVVLATTPLLPYAAAIGTGTNYAGQGVYVGQDVYLGTEFSDRPSVDNIHNHLISTR